MTLALQMYRSLSRTAVGKAMGGRVPGLLSGYAAPLRLITLDEPAVDRPGWARLTTRLSGVCGSDLGALSGATSLYFSGLVSLPFVPGHEVVADLAEDCEDLAAGTRVVIDPILTCAARGLAGDEECDECRSGATNRCARVTVGGLKPGLQTGFCSDTGGGWGETLTAHRSQLHVVPDHLTDQQAVLIEPMACAVHTAQRARIASGDSVLVSGAGAVGLLATFALRNLTDAGPITVVAKHKHQREHALAMGATEVVGPSEGMRRLRRSTGALLVRPEYSTPFLLGGVDVAVDAVGSKSSLTTALHSTRAGGRVVLSGMPAAADLSAAWFRELEVVGTYASARQEPNGKPAFETAIDLVGRDEIRALSDHIATYPLHRWREALDHAHATGRLGTLKVAFSPGSSS